MSRLLGILERAIAAQTSAGRRISFGDDAGAYREIASETEAVRKADVYAGRDGGAPYVIESVELTVDGVKLDGQWSRPATRREAAALERDDAREHESRSFRIARIS